LIRLNSLFKNTRFDNTSKGMIYMGAGRPTEYKPEYCDQIIEYFSVQPFHEMYKEEFFKDGTLKSRTPTLIANEFPTFQGFADSIGVHVDTLHEWKKVNKEFSEAYARAKDIQEKIWLVNGMQNLYNAQFAQFFGKNCLGYSDKYEIEAKQEAPDLEQLDARIQQLLSELPEEDKRRFLNA
jgi:hypothetical protein